MWVVVETGWFMSSDESEPVAVHGMFASEREAQKAANAFREASEERFCWNVFMPFEVLLDSPASVR
jgi:hypothetical protein